MDKTATTLSKLFTLHSKETYAGDPLANYTISEVKNVNTTTGPPPQVRSVVLLAKHAQLASKALAIKLVTIDGRLVTKDGILREQRIHYALTQWDARITRETVPSAQANPGAGYFATEDPKKSEEAPVRLSIINTEERNIVPLYDFAVINGYKFSTIPQVPRREKIPPLATNAPSRVGMLVMDRFDKTLRHWLRDAQSMVAIVHALRDALVQMCALVHMLMAAGFTHADLHPENIAVYPAAATTRVIQLARTRFFVLPQRAGVDHFALLDFGFSRLDFKDATGRRWKLEPSADEQRARLKTYTPPADSFVPGGDVFRLVISLLSEFAKAMVNNDVSEKVDATTLVEFGQFGEACHSVLEMVPQPTSAQADFVQLKSLAEAIANRKSLDDINDLAVKVTELKNVNDLFWRFYTGNRAVVEGPLPWDALRYLGHVDNRPLGEHRDITIAVPYGRGKVFDTTQVEFTNDLEMRVSSLNVYKTQKDVQ